MKMKFSLKAQIALGLLVGLVMGYFFSSSIVVVPNNPGNGVATLVPSPRPFITLPGAWMVRINLHRSLAPEVVKVTWLSEGRLTVMQSGENLIHILAADGSVLYEQSFQAEFVKGEPPQPVDEITLILVLPVVDGAKTLVIITPNGEAHYEFPTH